MKRKPRKAPHEDAALIEACMAYCEVSAGVTAMFSADPDGNCAFASRRSNTLDKAARGSLKTATKLSAQTMLGLSAKARAALFLFGQDLSAFDVIDDHHRAFVLAFAKDVKRHSDFEEQERSRRRAEESKAKAVA